MGDSQQQCLFRILDQITFYPIKEAELNAAQACGSQRQLVHIEHGVLDLAAHEAWANSYGRDIVATALQRTRALKAVPFLDDLIRTHEEPDAAAGGHGCSGAADEDGGDGCERVKAGIPGRCWKVLVKETDKLEAGSVLVSSRLASALHRVFLSLSFLSFLVHLICNGTDRLTPQSRPSSSHARWKSTS